MTTLPADVKDKIASLLAKAEKETVVSSSKAICALLRQHGMLYDMKVHCRHVGVHISNRDGTGVSATSVQHLLSNIVNLGWDAAEVKALAIEQDDQSREEAIRFNEDLVTNAEGSLGPIRDKLLFLSLQGSHTNQALRSVYYECPHPNPLLTENGLLSLAKIEGKDKALAEAVRTGCNWQVVTSAAVRMFPSLPQLLQTAGNASGQIAQGEHEVQMLQRILASWKLETSRLKPGFQVDFSSIKSRVSASASGHNDSIAPMYSFIMKFCGGEAAPFLNESVQFVNHHGQPTLKLGSQFYHAISTDTKGNPLERLVQVRHGALKLAYSSTEPVGKLDVMRLISASDKDFKKKVRDAEDLMNEYRVTLKPFLAKHDNVRMMIHRMDCDMIRFLLGRRLSRNYKCMEAIIHDFYKLVSEAAAEVVPSRFADAAALTEDWPLKTQPTQGSSSALAMVKYDENSRVVNLEEVLASKGYTIGATIKQCKGGMEGVISGITNDTVSVTHGEGCTDVPASQLLASEWTIVKPKAGPQMLDLARFSFKASREYEVQVIKAKIVLEMNEMSRKHQDCEAGLEVFVKPNLIRTNRSFRAGSLVLVPISTKIIHKFGDKSCVPPSALRVETEVDHVQFWLGKPTAMNATSTEGMVVPFWYLETSSDPDVCNMSMTYVRGDAIRIPVYKNIKPVPSGQAIVGAESVPEAQDAAPKKKKSKHS
jgi:hypothetical protein